MTGVQTCALPIYLLNHQSPLPEAKDGQDRGQGHQPLRRRGAEGVCCVGFGYAILLLVGLHRSAWQVPTGSAISGRAARSVAPAAWLNLLDPLRCPLIDEESMLAWRRCFRVRLLVREFDGAWNRRVLPIQVGARWALRHYCRHKGPVDGRITRLLTPVV